MSGRHKAAVHWGTPSPQFQDWETVKVYCHGFADLSTARGARVDSPEFTCLGNRWILRMYPGGSVHARDNYISVRLVNASEKGISILYGFGVKKKYELGRSHHPSRQLLFWGVRVRGMRDHIKFCQALKNHGVSGRRDTYHNVYMKLADPTKERTPPFIPVNPSVTILQSLFMDKESADIQFEVGERRGKNNAEKIAKIAPTTFHAHRLILQKSSTTLANLCGAGGDQTTPIQINDVSPDIFNHLLKYVYGGKVSDDDMKAHAKEIINVADRFGVASLKLEAEACLVEATVFAVENVMDYLLYAYSKNCALLKEAALEFMLENKVEVLKKVSLKDAPGGLG
ncbi:hypothetical protein ACHAW5_002467 [Stephanodiscus triporus]|uniref:BTB domain-containing protein n=1 Tax=Stephanodiscus triporus TaxID=2934178 RepID=A0ABD3N740_9STRA